ncbi:MAG: SpoIID/LytB domain-containing protein [Endomicrobium sp.]|jgi:stage II sporulation protein D|nr:SpoIID/LytB domain-containing protein [Endomicrobium sp.]
MKKLYLIIFFVLFSFYDSYALVPVQKNIRIGIIIGVSSFKVGSSKDFFIYDSLNRKFKLSKGTVNISSCQNGVRIGKYNLPLPVNIKPSKNGVIFANSKPYRGCLSLIKSGKRINVVNILDTEDYIKGVLPREVIANWHMEALKTQAVVSRTYAVYNLNRHLSEGFDLCSTDHCQSYGGLGAETGNTNQAVFETHGQVLTYDGELIQTVFHDTCAGHTEDPKYIWDWKETPSYLRGVKCCYCCNSPHMNWEQTFDEDFIRDKLKDNNIGEIRNIKIKEKTPAGAAKELEIIHSNGKCIMNAYKFRLIVDAQKIKSHLFDSIKVENGKIYFKGKGWGHKAGLCQYGAKCMAEKGETYLNILYYFYPKTAIKTIEYIYSNCKNTQGLV